MKPEDRERRRDTFLGDASDYAAVRPAYPSGLLEQAIAAGGLGPGDSLLEIGCGTGQATGWFAERGFRVLALDRSRAMVRFAREHLRDRAGVQVRLQDFEALEPSARFDAILAATSYHWLEPSTRAARCASHLRPGGSLILLWHTHPPPFTGFFERVQAIYERTVPEWQPPPSPGMSEERIRTVLEELGASRLYSDIERHAVEWSRAYTRTEYERLLRTYSDHASLAPDQRRALIDSVGDLIDAEFGGAVVRPYRTEMVLARAAQAIPASMPTNAP